MKALLARIARLQEAITKGNEYLETGRHADWNGFRPLFTRKVRNDQTLPPHRDWVKNVFLRRIGKELSRAEKALDRLEQS